MSNQEIEKLERELEEKKDLLEEAKGHMKKSERPEPVDNPEIPDNVISMCESYLDSIENDGFPDRDTDSYVFESIMKAIYPGQNVWKWINEYGP